MPHPFWFGHLNAPKPKPTPVTPAVALLIDAGEHERPHGSYAETFAPTAPQQTTVSSPITIPPPPWAGQVGPAPLASGEPEGTLGERALANVLPYSPAPYAPPDRSFVPLQRPTFDPPDWRAEERLRWERDHPEPPTEEKPTVYPPPWRE